MAAAHELREASKAANALLVAIAEARGDAELFGQNADFYRDRQVYRLYDVESAIDELNRLWTEDIGLSFAAVNQCPVVFGEREAPSAHEAIREAGMEIFHVSFSVIRHAMPDHYQPGVEYLCPPLMAADDLKKYADVAAQACMADFPAEPTIQKLFSLRQQELGRTLAAASTSPASANISANSTAPILPTNPDHRELWLYLHDHRESSKSENQLAKDFNNETGSSTLQTLRNLKSDGKITGWK